jgi:desulfoferrodoxin (superoxide reductase-like protein)
MVKKYFLMTVLLISFMVPLYANKSSVVIDAPAKASKGEVIKIKVNVSHNGNNFIHHTEWAYISVNGKEIARWKFSAGSLPESENFSRDVSYTVEGPFTIEAEASCNIHGSSGKAEQKVDVE